MFVARLLPFAVDDLNLNGPLAGQRSNHVAVPIDDGHVDVVEVARACSRSGGGCDERASDHQQCSEHAKE